MYKVDVWKIQKWHYCVKIYIYKKYILNIDYVWKYIENEIEFFALKTVCNKLITF